MADDNEEDGGVIFLQGWKEKKDGEQKKDEPLPVSDKVVVQIIFSREDSVVAVFIIDF